MCEATGLQNVQNKYHNCYFGAHNAVQMRLNSYSLRRMRSQHANPGSFCAPVLVQEEGVSKVIGEQDFLL